jgi:hypothetical protein
MNIAKQPLRPNYNTIQLYKNYNKLCSLMNINITLSRTNPIRIINKYDIPIYRNINENINCDKTVVSVYCKNYGIGDYLRGSIVLAHYAKYFGINFKLCMNAHTICNYLNDVEPIQQPLTENIENYNIATSDPKAAPYYKLYLRFIQFIRSPKKSLYIETNMCYNMKVPSQDIKNLINFNLSFKKQYYDMVEQLIDLPSYQVLHIRFGDNYFSSDPDNRKVYNLYREITKLNLPTNTIVMSNSYIIKKKINKAFGFHFIDKSPVHSALITDLNSDNFETTVIEYIILSKSTRTYCFTCLYHGSGFSEQCSVLNNIPYQVHFIDI